MPNLIIHQIPVLKDNFVYLLHDSESGESVAIDPAVATPVLDVLELKGWTLSHIWNTHHHNDHTGGNLELKQATGCSIVGSAADASRIPGIDVQIVEEETQSLSGAILHKSLKCRVIQLVILPIGLKMIIYYFLRLPLFSSGY